MASISISSAVSYNPRSKRLCPSHWGFLFVTLFFVGVPTAISFYLVLFLAPAETPTAYVLQGWEQTLCIILMVISVSGSIRNLIKASITEPGIIPRTKIENDEMVPNPTQDYFVSYRDAEQLKKQQKAKGASDVEMYYDLKKF